MKATPGLTNFTAGEISPRLDGRVDLSKYFNALKTLYNMIVFPHGGATRRAGTKMIAEVKNSASPVRLIPFEFSDEQSYMIEAGDLYMRFYMDQGQILWTDDANMVTNANFTTGIDGWSNQSTAPSYVAWNAASMLGLWSDGTNYAHAERQVNLASPGVYHTLDFAVNSVTPVLLRLGTSSLAQDLLVDTSYASGVHSVDFATNAATALLCLQFRNGNGGTVTIDDVDLYRTYYEISSPVNAVSLPVLSYAQNADTMFMAHQQMRPSELTRTGHTAWTLNAVDFSAGSANPFDSLNNYPAIVNFYEQRTAWACTRNAPQTLWFSASADPRNLGTGPLDDNAMQFEIAAENVNRIKWMAPLKVLLFGTIGGEWRISSETVTEPLTPTNVYARRESNYGSGSGRPVVIGNSVIYVQKHDRILRELRYSFETDGWISPELTLMAEHLTGAANGATIVETAYAGDPHSIIWAVRQDGGLIGMTYNRAQEIAAWHHHETDGEVESIAVIPGYLSGRDEVWLLVKRTIAGQVKRFVEVMEDTEWSDAQDAWYVDCGLKYDGNAATTISGLDHLNGASVAILADGYVVPQQTVVAGEIVLTNAASKVIVGLPYTSRLQTMRIEAGAAQGTAQTKKKRINEIALRLYRSGEGFDVGPDADTMDLVTLRQDTDLMDTAVPLFTGDVIMHPPSDWDTDGHIWIEQTLPLPLTITMIVPRVTTSEYA